MSRSGGTLQYQIAAETVIRLGLGRGIGFGRGLGMGDFDSESGWLICKKEPAEPWALAKADKAISIIRDPRDVLCSFMRWRKKQGRYDSFEKALEETILATQWFTAWESKCDYVARYETFCAADEAKRVGALFGKEITDETANQIALNYTIEANRERMERMENWINPCTMLTKAHIGEQGGRSIWRETLTIEQVLTLEKRLCGWMSDHEYRLLDCD